MKSPPLNETNGGSFYEGVVKTYQIQEQYKRNSVLYKWNDF